MNHHSDDDEAPGTKPRTARSILAEILTWLAVLGTMGLLVLALTIL